VASSVAVGGVVSAAYARSESVNVVCVSVGAGNGLALWVSDVDGTLIKIARTSDTFEVAPGDVRTITGIGGLGTSGGQDGRPINLSDNGDLAFQLDFSDGSSGLFVSHVPEPASMALSAIAVASLARRRRRH